MNYNWDWGLLFVEPYLGFLVSGLRTTVLIALAAWVIAFSLGSLLGIARTTPLAPLRFGAATYVELFRGVPLLVQMFLWFFVVPEIVPRDWGRWLKRTCRIPSSGRPWSRSASTPRVASQSRCARGSSRYRAASSMRRWRAASPCREPTAKSCCRSPIGGSFQSSPPSS
jgi:His/Glu/Gln/Arg/opine family amino acid ABC transporter permease subunit